MRVQTNPLYHSSVGFDRLVGVLDNLARCGETVAPGFPPYNIERIGESGYRVTMAVAGFRPDELEVTTEGDNLRIAGKPEKTAASDDRDMLYRGIAHRAFDRRFTLAEHVRVTGAQMENGLLHVDLKREVPEEKRPRTIDIQTG